MNAHVQWLGWSAEVTPLPQWAECYGEQAFQECYIQQYVSLTTPAPGAIALTPGTSAFNSALDFNVKSKCAQLCSANQKASPGLFQFTADPVLVKRSAGASDSEGGGGGGGSEGNSEASTSTSTGDGGTPKESNTLLWVGVGVVAAGAIAFLATRSR